MAQQFWWGAQAAQVSKHGMFRYLSGFEPWSILLSQFELPWAALSSLGGHERPLRFADVIIINYINNNLESNITIKVKLY
jgi:hypothetical protein